MRALLLIPLLVGACVDERHVETRTCNRTGFEITQLSRSTNMSLGVLAIDECTPYEVEQGAVYRYTGATFSIGSDRFDYQPIDFVGEKPLPSGQWSYELRILSYANHSISVLAVEN